MLRKPFSVRMTVLVVGAALLAATAKLVLDRSIFSRSHVHYPSSFLKLAPNLYRLRSVWQPLPGGMITVTTSVFAVRFDHDWVLVDTGPAEAQGGGNTLVEALHILLQSGDRLRMAVYTYSHPDHVGGTSQLLPMYKDLLHVVHEAELPFWLGQKSLSSLAADNLGAIMMKTIIGLLINNPVLALPDLSERTIAVRGESGDLADISHGGNKPGWTPPKGGLTFIHAPGHATGLMALVHGPSQSLLLGDAASYLNNKKGHPALALSPSPNVTQAKQSVAHVANYPGWQRAYPSHDDAAGVTPADLKDFASSLK